MSMGKDGISIKTPSGSPPAVRNTAIPPSPLAWRTTNPPSPEGIIRGCAPEVVAEGMGITGRKEKSCKLRML